MILNVSMNERVRDVHVRPKGRERDTRLGDIWRAIMVSG
jgi:hypothetical protein